MLVTTSMPLVTLPKTQCLPSSHAVCTVHRKNCEPLVLGPALAIESTPGPVCLSTVLIRELGAVDGLAAGAVVVGEVAALAHELGDHAVEGGALEAEALLAGAQRRGSFLLDVFVFVFVFVRRIRRAVS